MTQQNGTFPVGNGVPSEGAQDGHKRNGMNLLTIASVTPAQGERGDV